MADFPPSRTAHAARFANGVRREVVVQHEVFAVLALQGVDYLLVLTGAQCRHAEGLGLAAREQGRSMRTGEHPDFRDDRADGPGVAPVDTNARIQDCRADDVGLEMLEQGIGLINVQALGGELRHCRLFRRFHPFVAQLLVLFAIRVGELVARDAVETRR